MACVIYVLLVLMLQAARSFKLTGTKCVPTHIVKTPLHMSFANNLMVSIADVAASSAEGEYVYGAVVAPGWVLPLGCVLTVLTAAVIPVLLRPGEEALDKMRALEKETGNEFNKKRKDLESD